MTGLLKGASAAAAMRPSAAVSSGKKMNEATRGSNRRRSTQQLLLPLLLLRLDAPSRGQLSARASAQPDNSNLESALAKIDKLEAENRKLRELLLDGDRASAATEPLSTSTSSSPAAGAAAAAPLPTSLRFQAAEEPAVVASVSSSSPSSTSSSFDVSNVAWPNPGEPFWERSPTKTARTKKTSAAAVSSAPSPPVPVPSNENDIIFHVAAELAPRAKVGGLGDVVAGLARECTSRGRRAVVVLPFYECLPEDAVEGLELADEFPCPKGKPGDGRRGGNVEQLGVSAFSGRLDGIEVLLLRPDWSKTNLFRGGRIYGGSYNEAEA
jgi:starch synthase